jgi:hypothetical protein
MGPALRQALVLVRSRPKQFIKQITKPCLEHIHFPRGDGDAFRPIIGNGPSRKIMLGRPSDPLAAHVQIVMQVYRVLRTEFGRGAAHVYSITPRTILANSQYCSATRTGKILSLPSYAGLLPLSGILAPGRTSDSQSRPQAAKRWRDSASLDGMELVWRVQACSEIAIVFEKVVRKNCGNNLKRDGARMRRKRSQGGNIQGVGAICIDIKG